MIAWPAAVTMLLFGLAAIAIIPLSLIMRRLAARYPDAYWAALWRGTLFAPSFFKGRATRPELAVVLTCFALVTLLFAWVLMAIMIGWLKPVIARG